MAVRRAVLRSSGAPGESLNLCLLHHPKLKTCILLQITFLDIKNMYKYIVY